MNEIALLDRLISAQLGGCTCTAKSPELQWHDTQCTYRLCREAQIALTAANAEIEKLRLLQFSSLGDNHHNALVCPYCNPDKQLGDVTALRAKLAECEKDANDMEMTMRRAFYKLHRGMPIPQQVMERLKFYSERNANVLRGSAIAAGKKEET